MFTEPGTCESIHATSQSSFRETQLGVLFKVSIMDQQSEVSEAFWSFIHIKIKRLIQKQWCVVISVNNLNVHSRISLQNNGVNSNSFQNVEIM